MKAVESKITIYKEGEDITTSDTMPLLRKIVAIIKEAGFEAQLDFQSGSIEIDEKK